MAIAIVLKKAITIVFSILLANSDCTLVFPHKSYDRHSIERRSQLKNGHSFTFLGVTSFLPAVASNIFPHQMYDDILLFDDTCVKHRFVVCIYIVHLYRDQCAYCV